MCLVVSCQKAKNAFFFSPSLLVDSWLRRWAGDRSKKWTWVASTNTDRMRGMDCRPPRPTFWLRPFSVPQWYREDDRVAFLIQFVRDPASSVGDVLSAPDAQFRWRCLATKKYVCSGREIYFGMRVRVQNENESIVLFSATCLVMNLALPICCAYVMQAST